MFWWATSSELVLFLFYSREVNHYYLKQLFSLFTFFAHLIIFAQVPCRGRVLDIFWDFLFFSNKNCRISDSNLKGCPLFCNHDNSTFCICKLQDWLQRNIYKLQIGKYPEFCNTVYEPNHVCRRYCWWCAFFTCTCEISFMYFLFALLFFTLNQVKKLWFGVTWNTRCRFGETISGYLGTMLSLCQH